MTHRHEGYSEKTVMKELISDNDFLLHVISRFDIAFGFGDRTIAQVCADNNVHVRTFLAVCNLISGYGYEESETSLPALIGYLRRAHSSILEITLPHIRNHLVEGIGYSGADNKLAILLMRFFDQYVGEVRTHMQHEDDVVFCHAERLLKGEDGSRFSIAGYSADHISMSEKLRELKDLFIYHYSQRDNYRLSAVLFDIILCEKDLESHFRVENSLFIPAVARLEEKCGMHKSISEPDSSKGIEILSEREKEVVYYIAKGLPNKQIADKLCLSTHTVATHRRNICSKLDIHSASGLTLYAIVHKLIDIADINI